MIGLDTNVLLRALLDDQSAETPRARQLLTEQSSPTAPAFINHVALCEVLRVLQRACRYRKDQLVAAIETLLRTAMFELDGRDVVEEALAMFRSGEADFADALIGVLNRRAGCATTYTFDRDAAALPVFTAVPGS